MRSVQLSQPFRPQSISTRILCALLKKLAPSDIPQLPTPTKLPARLMKVALLNGLLFCAALLTAHTSTAVFAAVGTSNSQSQSSSSSQASSVFVAVRGDAVYCVEGPVCSGDVAHDPVGSSCPRKGDMAIDACMKGIPSFTALGQCVAPADAECRVVPGTQTWGCMWKAEEASTATQTPAVAVESVSAASQSANSIPHSSESVITSEPPATQQQNLRVANAVAATTTTDSESESSGGSTTAIWIGSVAGVCVIVAAIAVAVVVVSTKKRESQKQSEQKEVVITPENMPAATPKLSKTVFVYTAQI